jgi:hypothetical protein
MNQGTTRCSRLQAPWLRAATCFQLSTARAARTAGTLGGLGRRLAWLVFGRRGPVGRLLDCVSGRVLRAVGTGAGVGVGGRAASLLLLLPWSWARPGTSAGALGRRPGWVFLPRYLFPTVGAVGHGGRVSLVMVRVELSTRSRAGGGRFFES